MEKALTIIIPTYKRSSSLPGVIDSVIQQSYKNWRIRVSDDCSKDDTHNVVKQIIDTHKDYDIEYFCNDTNLREKMNVNFALARNYQTKYVAVLQDDCRYIDKQYLQNAVEILDKYENVNFVTGHFKNKQGIVKLWDESVIQNGKNFWYRWPNPWVFWPVCVFRYDVLMKLGGIDTSIEANFDCLLLLKAGLLGDVCLLDSLVVEDEYNKISGTYEGFYADKKGVLQDKERYFSSAASFAVKCGVDAAVVYDWYTKRVASWALAEIKNCNDINVRRQLIEQLNKYDKKITDLVLVGI